MLKELAQLFSYEIAIGYNLKCFIKAETTFYTICIINAIQKSTFLSIKKQKKMIQSLKK